MIVFSYDNVLKFLHVLSSIYDDTALFTFEDVKKPERAKDRYLFKDLSDETYMDLPANEVAIKFDPLEES